MCKQGGCGKICLCISLIAVTNGHCVELTSLQFPLHISCFSIHGWGHLYSDVLLLHWLHFQGKLCCWEHIHSG